MNPTALFLAIIGHGSCHSLAFGADKTSPRRIQINPINLADITTDPSSALITSSYSYSSSQFSSSRKQFFLSMTSSFTISFLGATILPIHQHPPTANANEPSNPNLFYQSTTTEGVEDPLVVFGKSLDTGIVEPKINTPLEPLTISVIVLPSTDTNSDSAPSMQQVGGDLNKALQNKLGESQKKRAINPLTHG